MVKRAFDTLDELGDIVQRKPRLQIAQIAGSYLEGPPLGGDALARQPSAQRVVDDLAKGSPGTLRFRLELGHDIIVQGKRRPHVLMLGLRHHDVNSLTTGHPLGGDAAIRDCVLLALEAVKRGDRAEGLLLGDDHVGRHIGQHGRLEEAAAPPLIFDARRACRR